MKGGAGTFDFLEDVGRLCGPARQPLVWGSRLSSHKVEAAYDNSTKPFL
jgi:hypothetical protein